MLDQPAPFQNLVQPLQLRQAECGRNVAHGRLIGRCRTHDDGGALFQTVRAMAPHRHRDVDVIGDHHTALAAGQRGRLGEIEHRGIAEGSDQRALVF